MAAYFSHCSGFIGMNSIIYFHSFNISDKIAILDLVANF